MEARRGLRDTWDGFIWRLDGVTILNSRHHRESHWSFNLLTLAHKRSSGQGILRVLGPSFCKPETPSLLSQSLKHLRNFRCARGSRTLA